MYTGVDYIQHILLYYKTYSWTASRGGQILDIKKDVMQ